MDFVIKGLDDERYLRPLQLIANLFFENCSVQFHSTGENFVIVQFHIKKYAQSGVVDCILFPPNEKSFTASFPVQTDGDVSEKEAFRSIKNGVLKSFLTVLQQWTGIIQQWGILTGIRPTKLLHKQLEQGIENEVAHKMLKESYLISDKKIALMQKIVDRQLAVIPDLYKINNEVSIYIGIPFCPTKCAYCTFPAYAIGGREDSVKSFLHGLHYEMEQIGKWLKENEIPITTIYFGGGTPTSITAEQMDQLYDKMYEFFPDVEKVREITVEAGRPDTITKEKLDVLKKWNIDRISINPQSYTDETLKAIGRHHSVEDTIEKFQLARKEGMTNINMDLIIGLPGEGIEEFAHSLKETEKLMPESLTIHTLSFKRASEMTKNREKYKVADRNEIKKMMELAEKWTEEHQYVPYYLYRQKNILGNLENVGYAKPNKESIYNILIMEEVQTIIGLGCGAASKLVSPTTGKITRFANPKDPKMYNDRYKAYTDKKIALLDELFLTR